MRKILTAFAMIGALALGAASAQAQNVLGNPGFEALLPNPTTPIGNWATFAGSTASSTQVTTQPHSGAMHMALETGARDTFAGIYQDIDVPVLPGYSVTFSGWQKATTDPLGANIEIKFEWTGGPGTEIVSDMLPSVGDYKQFSITKVAQPGVTDLRVTYAIATFADGLGDSTVYLDDMSVTVVPEPATIGGLAIALAGLVHLRRRK
jgi:opacity protein-like surface antigen